MKKAIIGLSVCAILIGGCTTMKALETTGDEFSKGNIGTGLYMGTMGVAVSAIYDVFTLGGALSPNQAADTLTQSAAQKEKAKAQSGTPSDLPSSLAGLGVASQSQTAEASPAGTGSGTSGTQDSKGPPQNRSDCFLYKSGYVHNRCSVTIRYSYCIDGARPYRDPNSGVVSKLPDHVDCAVPGKPAKYSGETLVPRGTGALQLAPGAKELANSGYLSGMGGRLIWLACDYWGYPVITSVNPIRARCM